MIANTSWKKGPYHFRDRDVSSGAGRHLCRVSGSPWLRGKALSGSWAGAHSFHSVSCVSSHMETLQLDRDNALLPVSSLPAETRPLLRSVQTAWTQWQGHLLTHCCDNSMWHILWSRRHAPVHAGVCVCLPHLLALVVLSAGVRTSFFPVSGSHDKAN